MRALTDRTIVAEDIELILQDVGNPLSRLSGSTVLITGASGFLCSYLVETLAALNDSGLHPPCHVLAADNLRTSVPERLAHLEGRGDVLFLRQDITLPFDPARPVDWIIHGASIASPTLYRRYPLETIDVNVTGTRHMLELARQHRVKSMLYFSTSEIYGDPDTAHIPTGEDYRGYVSSTGPRACYDESKRLGETLCVTFHQLFRVPVKIVRPFNVYGPGQPLQDGRIIPDLMTAAVRRNPIVLFSDGRASRAFCYVADAVRAMCRILLSDGDGEAFNVGNDEKEVSIRGLSEIMRQVAGPPWLDIQYRASQDVHYTTDNPQRRCPDLTKLRSRFPWEPKVTLESGLTRTLSYYQETIRAECR
jgi:dTDP-glucose 4,6-dehydratase/UDP-glucuronate decarboxylase